jgi:hypothetical protein
MTPDPSENSGGDDVTSAGLNFIEAVHNEFAFLEEWGFSFLDIRKSRVSYQLNAMRVRIERDLMDYQVYGSICDSTVSDIDADLGYVANVEGHGRVPAAPMGTVEGVRDAVRFYADVVEALGKEMLVDGRGFPELLMRVSDLAKELTRQVVAGTFNWREGGSRET